MLVRATTVAKIPLLGNNTGLLMGPSEAKACYELSFAAKFTVPA